MTFAHPHALLLALLCVLLSACSSQMDEIGDIDIRPSPPVPAGIYVGDLTTVGGDSAEITVLVDSVQKRMIGFDRDGTTIAAGLYTANEPALTWTAQVYSQGTVGGNPVTVVTKATAAGTFRRHQFMQLQYSTDQNDTGSINADYSAARYERIRSNIADELSGTWALQDPFGNSDISISIDNEGAFFGTNTTTDCIYSGRFEIIDLHYNLYRVTGTKVSCTGIANPPELTGLATVIKPARTVGAPPTIPELQMVAVSRATSLFLHLKKN